jgi:alpha-glucosidase (family GH31 glycosyl hydrolase)
MTVTVAAPLGQPGVFYREGSAVAAQFVNNLQEAGHGVPGAEMAP